jgi:hypothetical protein
VEFELISKKSLTPEELREKRKVMQSEG